jgi:type IV pilus assembly protein PilM
MATKYVGIDLGSHHVKLAVLTAGFRGAQLVDAFEVPLPPPTAPTGGDGEPDPYLPALQAALVAMRERNLLSETVGIALPAAAVSYRLLSFPFAEERRIAQTIAFEADGQFPVPLEQLAHGHIVVPAPQGGRALLVAVKRERVEQLSTIFKRAGAELKVVTSAAMSLVQIVDPEVGSATPAMTEAGTTPVSLVLDLGHGSSEIIAVGPKGPIAVRSIRRAGRHVTAALVKAFGIDPASADEAKQRDAFVPHRGQTLSTEQLQAGALVASAIEPIVREIEHTRLWLRTTHRHEVARIVLAGGASHLGGLAGYLEEQTGLSCSNAKLRSGLSLRGAEGKDLATYGAAIGAAWGAARRPLVQLHDEKATQSDSGWVQERIGSLAAIGIAVLAFGAVDTIVRVKALDAERAAYEAQLADSTREVFGSSVALGEVKTTLDAAEGSDITSLIAQRGALEVLALIVQAATPSDLGKTPIPRPEPAAPDDEGGAEAPAEAPPVAPATPPAAAETVKLESGIVVADSMVFTLIDIRERRIEMKIEASNTWAQERLAFRLRDIACLSNIDKSKVKGDERKLFEIGMDNNCYFASSLGSGEESESEDPASDASRPAASSGISIGTPNAGAEAGAADDEGGAATPGAGSEGGG